MQRGLFVAKWLLSSRPIWITPVETIGWGGATFWVLRYDVLTVRAHEAKSFAAVVRHLLPAVLSFVVVVFSDLVGSYTHRYTAVVDAVWVIGTVLVVAFLFNTAVDIRGRKSNINMTGRRGVDSCDLYLF